MSTTGTATTALPTPAGSDGLQQGSMRVADPLVCAESHPGLHGFCHSYEEFVGVRLRVFHRVVQGLAGVVMVQVMSIHRPDGQCCPARRCMELFRWQGGFRVACVPTIPNACECVADGSQPWPTNPTGVASRKT